MDGFKIFIWGDEVRVSVFVENVFFSCVFSHGKIRVI